MAGELPGTQGDADARMSVLLEACGVTRYDSSMFSSINSSSSSELLEVSEHICVLLPSELEMANLSV